MEKNKLPSAFIDRMEVLLQGEMNEFMNSFDGPRTQGLRLNALKAGLNPAAVSGLSDKFELKPVPWCQAGYYYEEPHRPGKHPYHSAGLYYIQEPSAMSAAEMLDPQPGETVLDLAAAPGGKTSHIASKMQGQGLLVSNEIHPERAKILAENVERMGITRCVVTSAAPDELSRRFPLSFDRIMLDAPCSGEGMFRKDPGAVLEWSPELVEVCAARQWDIIREAHAMLKPGGVMAYSTCTFNTSENEDLIARFLGSYPDMEPIAQKRLWPHKERGEGHFVALLRKAKSSSEAEAPETSASVRRKNLKPGKTAAQEQLAWKEFSQWAEENVAGLSLGQGKPLRFGDELYYLPVSGDIEWTGVQLQGLKMPRAGLHLAHLKKNRVEPAHALAMAMSPDQCVRQWDMPAESEEAAAFLHGETLQLDPALRGWTLVAIDGLPVGWGKSSGGQLKNHLPKGLRSNR
ncbi:RsmB/NOP family class I SAM-dependent RNA methyltransferase [Paenibacillus sp. DMB20]|uniref:RsmB/NOP family class I SAM-dependent RNA methyltransferase n=1 Tax=Paenibacillus sp. DMB20 TaxID=1642570 RepID=UPI0006281109|nr:RsmB/NOP family class I SAM-dependent RNA methyltransferase [Paenibacillus sp. DMB20]KKO52779.1 RNA methyltransferase [Paenibacillus sp. DMB20]